MKQPSRQYISRISKQQENELLNLKKRIDYATILVLLFIGTLVFRLWFLQIHQGHKYIDLSENNRIRAQTIAAPRGDIFDRRQRLVITNRPSFNVTWLREDTPDPDLVIKKLTTLLNTDTGTLLDRIRLAADQPRYKPIRLAEDIDWPTLARIENRGFELPGIRIEALPQRQYLFADSASHLIGYLGEINQKELATLRHKGYRRGDQIGKMGLEKLLEDQLRGEKGQRYLEVDVHGFEQQQLREQQALPGNDIQLTLDFDLQRTAEEALTGKAGAVVAMEVNSGRLLVLASSPPLPITKFIGGISSATWQGLLDDPLHPLINKTIQGQYPPGSTYKIVTAQAGLAEKIITKDTIFYCPGSIKFGNRRYNCWKRSGHGAVNLRKALKESCDVYFYLVGQKLGVDRLAKYARSFGLGAKSGIRLENEKPGLVPTEDWKIRKYQRRWQEGETLSVAIGQGFNLATPLQICRMMSATVNGGILYRPQFIEKIVDVDGAVVHAFSPIRDGTVAGPKHTLSLIRQALIAAVNEKHGTGGAAKLKDILVGGKTGTAQVVRLRAQKSALEKEVPYKFRDHAWFTCFAPADKPEIAIAVLVEHGGHGGSAAGPIAKKVLMRYFELQKGESRPQ